MTAASIFLYYKLRTTVAKNDPAPMSYSRRAHTVGEVHPTSHLPVPLLKVRPTLPESVLSPHPPGSPEDGSWIIARIAAIHDLEWFDDTQSLLQILAELRNPVSQIREAALEATRNFGSRDAIPHLAARAAETGDLLEQKALIDLIEYLKLPTVIEQLAEEAEK